MEIKIVIKIFVYLKGKATKCEQEKREVSHPLVHSSTGWKGQGQAKANAGRRIFCSSPTQVQTYRSLGPSSSVSPDVLAADRSQVQQGTRLEVQQPELQLALLWDAGVPGRPHFQPQKKSVIGDFFFCRYCWWWCSLYFYWENNCQRIILCCSDPHPMHILCDSFCLWFSWEDNWNIAARLLSNIAQ